ncbi:class I SAM-dependent methyltransferase [Natronomonas amylolytica]|uniref:class I SAM-dependent methyltransferase n=1 Tax=Natronomonas amylolytica TaxID=3108498 RepID=UPI00300ADA52
MVEKNTVRRGYDELGDAYAAHRSGEGQGMDALSTFLEAVPESARILDAGCGPGRPVLSHLADAASAVGLDFSGEQLRLAAEHAPEAALVRGDMTTLPFAAETFDAVVAYWSLIHVPLADHRTVIDEFSRVLCPGGRLLVCEGTERWAGENPDWLDSGVGMEWEIAGAEATREQLHDAGFEITDSWGVPETLEDEEAGEDGDDADDDWTFFAARLR